jgi:hypothetical protein
MGDLHRPIHTWHGLEIDSEHYTDDDLVSYPWHRIVFKVRIFGY